VKYLKIKFFVQMYIRGMERQLLQAPLLGICKSYRVNRTRSFGLHASPCFMTQKNSGRVLHNNHFGKHKKYSSKNGSTGRMWAARIMF